MDNLTIAAVGEKVSFDGTSFVLSSFQSGAAAAEHSAVRVDSFGMKNRGSALGVRRIKLDGYIIACGDDEDEKESFLFEARRLLSRIVNPMRSFTLSRGKYSIECTPEASCEFLSNGGFFGKAAEKFSISAICFNPCFSEEITVANRASFDGSSVFPLVLSGDYCFGTKRSAQKLLADNPGDIDAGCVIELSFENDADRVRLELPTTGEHIEFEDAILAGDRVVIDTRRGMRGIVKHSGGKTESIIASLDLTSTFFALPSGEHEILIDARSGSESAYVNVKISLIPLYLSL